MKSWYGETAEKYGSRLRNSDGTLLSNREAAAIIGKGKTIAGEFMAWFKAQEPAGAATEALTTSDKSKTWVDEKSRVIFTDLGEYGIKHVTESEFRAIKRDYSRHYGGVAETRSQMALRYNFPTIKAFEIFARIHELRQNGLPYTDTELAEDGVDTLVDKTIESQRQEFFLKLNEREREQQKRDAEKWRAFEANARAIAQEVKSMRLAPLTVERVAIRNEAPPYLLLLPIQDIHIGKLALKGGRRVYDRQEALRRSLAATDDLLTQAMRLGRPEYVQLVIGGDFLHVDGPSLKTTRLTEQAGQTDGSYREIMTDAVRLAREQIERCRTISSVMVTVVHGNHDQQSMMWLGALLEAVYADCDDVAVTVQDDDGYVIGNYGDNTIMVLHGENLKQKDAYRVIVNAAETVGITAKRHKLIFTGHTHHEAAIDLNGVKLHIVASLSEPDAWHQYHHYSGATIETQAFAIRKSGGKAAVFYTHPDVLQS